MNKRWLSWVPCPRIMGMHAVRHTSLSQARSVDTGRHAQEASVWHPFCRAWACRPRSRAGITLLEVMIATGVLAVGVMSIASLLPVGQRQMMQAEVFDHASAVGRSAFRDMQVHGYLQPSLWLYCGTQYLPVTNGPLMLAPPSTARSPQTGAPANITAFQMTPPAMPLVLDPLMVAMNVPPSVGSNLTGATITTAKAVATFPYFLQGGGFTGTMPEATAPQIPRITLRDAPIKNTTTSTTIRGMPLGVADRLFRSTDDVAFVVPSAEISLAGSLNQNQNTSIEFVGVANAANTGSTLLTRASRGDYTFFAVVSPEFAETWGAPGGYPTGSSPQGSSSPYFMVQGSAASTRLFHIAVVVCYKRNLMTLANFTPATTYDRGERMVWIDFLGRGEIRLRASGITQLAQAQRLLSVQANQWIMATAYYQNFAPLPPINSSVMSAGGKGWLQTIVKWYRVLSASPQPMQDIGSQSTWYISARVTGPDWTINGACDGNPMNLIYQDANQFSYADLQSAQMPNPPTAWGTLVTGAIGVYEKTVNLDDASGFSY